MAWEVDWTHPANTGTQVWARNLNSHLPSGRQWHLVGTGYLRSKGVNTPTYRSDSWEVNWARRNGKQVWARNPTSKMPGARTWHWVDFHTIERAGLRWKPKHARNGRYVNAHGYVMLTRAGMSDDDVALAEAHGLFKGARRTHVFEHQLVAVKKYGPLPRGMVVRHVNGDKADNGWENLVLGTSRENTADHTTARLMAMYWRERAEALARALGVALGPGPWE